MMGHRQVEQAALFYEFSLEKHIPADHLMRSIDRFGHKATLRRRLVMAESGHSPTRTASLRAPQCFDLPVGQVDCANNRRLQ